MAESGGSSTISGVGYEQWVFVHFMIHVILNENKTIIITPQKVRENLTIPNSGMRNIAIDDLVINEDAKTTHYTIKQHATLGVWNVSQLISAGIIKEMKKQFEETPDRELVLISQSDSPIIRELNRLKGYTCREEIKCALSIELLKQWDTLKSAFDYDDNKMLEVSKRMKIKVIDENSMRAFIETSFKIKFNTPEHYSNSLFTFAFSRSISKLSTGRKDILNYLYENGIIEKTNISDNSIFSSLKNSTINLETSVSPFEIEHIERGVTTDIIEWILKEREWENPNNSKILTLAGKAGMGKTTVLQDVLKKLHCKNIPVLAIKADKVSFSNSEELRERLQLPDTVERILSRLSEKKELTVLLIDQIDALSLTLSTDRTQISKYKELITRCLKLPNVLIVLSCRTYDLNNDSDFNQYRVNQNIEVGPLSDLEITIALNHVNIDSAILTKETLELLSTPLHLSIFVQLSKTSISESINFTTLNDLYDELLKLLVLTNSNHKSLLELIDSVASIMYENQSLRINRVILESRFFIELNYLLSSGILQQSGREISFFHQTFFDYSLARSFVVSGKLISKELINDIQGLYQRPRVKAVLDYLYQKNKIVFLKECDTILFNSNFRVHLKYLVLNLIGFLDEEDKNSKAIGHKILNDDSLQVAFLKSITTPNWITFLVNDVTLVLSTFSLQEAVCHICHTNGSKFSNQTIDLLIKYWDQLENEQAVKCLRSCVNINNGRFIKLFEENKKPILEWNYLFFSILRSANEQGEYHFVGKQFCSLYEYIKDFGIDLNKGYLDTMFHQILVTLWVEAPDIAYHATKKLFLDICEYSQFKIHNGKYRNCEAYSSFYGDKKGGHREHYHLYEWLLKYLTQPSNLDQFNTDLDDFLKSEFEICLCLVLEVMINNPSMLHTKSYSLLLKNDLVCNIEESGSLLKYLTGELIHVIYPHLNQEKQDNIYNACMSSKDWFVSEWNGVKSRNTYLFAKRYDLIARIPTSLLFKHPDRKKQFQEFQRRFGVLEWKRPKGIETTISSGSIPLPDKAYSSMTFDELHDSFLKIGHGRNYRNRQVTIYGHAEAFQKLCKGLPLKYYDFVKRLIDETPVNTVNNLYSVQGILGLLESQLSKELKIEVVHSVFEKDKYFTSESYYLMRMLSHFARSGQITEKMFDYLIQKAVSISNNNDESFHHVLDELFQLIHQDEYKDKVLEVSTIISRGRNEKMKLHLLGYLAQLNLIDKNRAVVIFYELMVDLESNDKYSHAKGSIQYMVNVDMKLMAPILQKAILEIVDDKVIEWYGQLFGILWINEFEYSSELYCEAESKSVFFKEGILSISIEVVKEKPSDSVIYQRAMENIEKYLSEDNENMYNNYQSLIRSITKDNFLDYNQFLTRYIQSNVRKSKQRHRTLNQKLFELASSYPEECITLCELDLGTITFPEQFFNTYTDKNIFDVLVKAYNSLSNVFNDDIRIRTLDLMDETLKIAMLNQTFDLVKTFQTISQNEDN